MKKSSIAVLFVFLCMFSSQVHAQMSHNEKSYYENYRSILQVMKEAMAKAPQTGDPALDFLDEMIPHHEAAVSMAENILKYGTNDQVKKLAEAILREQLNGIAKMEELRNRLQANPQVNKQAEAAYIQAYTKIYNTMIAAMEGAKPSGNINRDFLTEMIPHHEAAIQMGKNILRYTQNRELRTIVQNMIATQQKQVAEMKNLLKTVR